MIELLYASGLRISELANARLEDFNFEQRIVRVTGKGNKTRLVPVGRKACEARPHISLPSDQNSREAVTPAAKFFSLNEARN